MSKKNNGRFWYSDDPMMDAVVWALIILLSTGFISGLSVGVGMSFILRGSC